jgi:hypothetical protein
MYPSPRKAQTIFTIACALIQGVLLTLSQITFLYKPPQVTKVTKTQVAMAQVTAQPVRDISCLILILGCKTFAVILRVIGLGSLGPTAG